MLGFADVTAYLRVAVPYTYTGNEFPPDGTSVPDDQAYVRMTGGFRPSEWTSKKRPSFQIVVRAKSPKTAEEKATAIYEHLHGRTEFEMNGKRIVKCVADQSSTLYLGMDSNKRTLYSVNFTVTLTD